MFKNRANYWEKKFVFYCVFDYFYEIQNLPLINLK